jgi:hypothetical protein
MCAVLEIGIRTYYKYRNQEDADYYDYLIIKNIFDKNTIDEWIMQDSNKNNTNNNDFIVNKLLNIAA